MLTRCPDCRREVSDVAPSCPQCGRPISATTIEATSKDWKFLVVVAWILALFGTFALIGGRENPAAAVTGTLMLVSAFVLMVVGKVGAWWSNG